MHPANVATRTNVGVIDIGAYESGTTLSLNDTSIDYFRVYPNPTSEHLSIKTKAIVKQILIFNTLGKRVLTINEPKQIDVSELENGIFFLKVAGEMGATSAITFIKK